MPRARKPRLARYIASRGESALEMSMKAYTAAFGFIPGYGIRTRHGDLPGAGPPGRAAMSHATSPLGCRFIYSENIDNEQPFDLLHIRGWHCRRDDARRLRAPLPGLQDSHRHLHISSATSSHFRWLRTFYFAGPSHYQRCFAFASQISS